MIAAVSPHWQESAAAEQDIEGAQKAPGTDRFVDSGWYLALGLGVAIVDFREGDLDRELSKRGFNTAAIVDQTDSSGKLVGGYHFNKHLSIEGGYVNLGKTAVSINNFGLSTPALTAAVSRSVPLAKQGAVLQAVGSWPIDDSFFVLGKAGGFVWHGTSDIKANSGNINISEDGLDLVLGFGLRHDITSRYAVRAEWERFFMKPDVDLITGGVEVSFE